MGYRINLSNVNSIGHLIEGNVFSFLDQTFLDDSYFEGNMKYIDDFVSDENSDFISSNQRVFESKRTIIRNQWHEVRELMYNTYYSISDNQDKENLVNTEYNPQLLNFIKKISNLLGGYKYKYLLLPGFENTKLNSLMINREVLNDLLTTESNSSYLILQLKELPEKNNVQILDSFEYMNKAINRINEWPAILLWENVGWGKSRGIFIPIRNSEEIRRIIDAQNYEKQYFIYLQKTYGSRKTRRTAQLIHLSDLHLGIKGEESRKLRLIEILKKHRRTTDSQIQMYPIISGDLVDTPSLKNEKLLESFESQLESIGLQNPITVLGNHDLFTKGFIRNYQNEKNILTSLASRQLVTVMDDLKLILICFNSNTDGNWAQGKIGQNQFSKIGNQLDRIIGKDDYFKIAILHHHPFEIEKPGWMRKTWYESILGKLSFDVDNSNILIDSKLLIEWLHERKIKFIIHGHKHIPKLFRINEIDIVAGGSSTGNISHFDKGKTFLTYNLINYDLEDHRPISSTIVFEDLIGSGTKNYQVEIY